MVSICHDFNHILMMSLSMSSVSLALVVGAIYILFLSMEEYRLVGLEEVTSQKGSCICQFTSDTRHMLRLITNAKQFDEWSITRQLPSNDTRSLHGR